MRFLLLLFLCSCQTVVDKTVEMLKPYIAKTVEREVSTVVKKLTTKYQFSTIDKNKDGIASIEELKQYGFWGLVTTLGIGLVAWWKRRKNGIKKVDKPKRVSS